MDLLGPPEHAGWDATQLHVHKFADGRLGDEIVTLGADDKISFCEPEFGIHGLRVCSDHEGWWNLYDVDHPCGSLLPVVNGAFDIATPPWVFGMQQWAAPAGAESSGERIFAVAGLPTGDEIIVDGRTIATADTSISSVSIHRPDAVERQGRRGDHHLRGCGLRPRGRGGRGRPVRRRDTPADGHPAPPRELSFDHGFLIEPEWISFPTGPGGTATAHGLFYPPTNPDCIGPDDERPPLLVLAHGGPTVRLAVNSRPGSSIDVEGNRGR